MGNDKSDKKPIPHIYGMFKNPNKLFELLGKNPPIWIPLLIVTFVYIIASTIRALSINVDDVKVIPGMTMEEAEMVLATVKAFIAISGFITPMFSILLITVMLFIIMKIFKNNTTFKQIFSMNTYIAIVGAVGLVVNNLIHMVLHTSDSQIHITSLAWLLNSHSPILGMFELFSLWEYTLLAIGLIKIANLSKSVSIIIVIIIFVSKIFIVLLNSTITSLLGL